MSLHPKRATMLLLALIILCTIQFTCVALAFSSSDTREESSSASIASGIQVESEATDTTDKSKHNETLNSKVPMIEDTVAPDMVFDKTENPADDEETETEDVITEDITELSKLSYTEDDLFYLAAAICREAGGASEEIQLLVANVVINRVNSSIYPDTIYGVLTQRMQYGTMWKYGISFPKWANQKIKDQCYSVARRVLEGERFCPENVLFQAEFKQGSGIYKQFKGYYFCYL